MGDDAGISPPRPARRRELYSTEVAVAGINIWRQDHRDFSPLRPLSNSVTLSEGARGELEEARDVRRPIWVEFELSRPWPDWYESWTEFDRPTVLWRNVQPVLSCLGVGRPDMVGPGEGALTTEVLRVLPFVYELGALRAFAEIHRTDKADRARLFPAAGFEVSAAGASTDGYFDFRRVRLNVASVDNLIFTLRPCWAETSDAQRVWVTGGGTGPPPLQVPLRYLPTGRKIVANDVVDGIALYLGATCEWIARAVESNLAQVEGAFFDDVVKKQATELASEEASKRLEDAFKRLNHLGEVMRTVEQELSLVLQRVPASGAVAGLEATRRVEPRYDDALKKVQAMQMQLRLAGETMASALSTQQFVVAEQHRRVADDARTETEKLQRAGTVLASVVLVPSLIAAVYGANVPIPGQRNAEGVISMVFFMLGGGLITWWMINLFSNRTKSGAGDRRPERLERGDAPKEEQPRSNRELDRDAAVPVWKLWAASGAALGSVATAIVLLVLQLSDSARRTESPPANGKGQRMEESELAEAFVWSDLTLVAALFGAVLALSALAGALGWRLTGRSRAQATQGDASSGGGDSERQSQAVETGRAANGAAPDPPRVNV